MRETNRSIFADTQSNIENRDQNESFSPAELVGQSERLTLDEIRRQLPDHPGRYARMAALLSLCVMSSEVFAQNGPEKEHTDQKYEEREAKHRSAFQELLENAKKAGYEISVQPIITDVEGNKTREKGVFYGRDRYIQDISEMMLRDMDVDPAIQVFDVTMPLVNNDPYTTALADLYSSNSNRLNVCPYMGTIEDSKSGFILRVDNWITGEQIFTSDPFHVVGDNTLMYKAAYKEWWSSMKSDVASAINLDHASHQDIYEIMGEPTVPDYVHIDAAHPNKDIEKLVADGYEVTIFVKGVHGPEDKMANSLRIYIDADFLEEHGSGEISLDAGRIDQVLIRRDVFDTDPDYNAYVRANNKHFDEQTHNSVNEFDQVDQNGSFAVTVYEVGKYKKEDGEMGQFIRESTTVLMSQFKTVGRKAGDIRIPGATGKIELDGYIDAEQMMPISVHNGREIYASQPDIVFGLTEIQKDVIHNGASNTEWLFGMDPGMGVSKILFTDSENPNARVRITDPDVMNIQDALIQKMDERVLYITAAHETVHAIDMQLGIFESPFIEAEFDRLRTTNEGRRMLEGINESNWYQTGFGGHSADNQLEFVASFVNTLNDQRAELRLAEMDPAFRTEYVRSLVEFKKALIEIAKKPKAKRMGLNQRSPIFQQIDSLLFVAKELEEVAQ